jgi:hypothetical protein
MDAAKPCGARFFDQMKRDLGYAVGVTKRVRVASLLTVLDVTGAEPELGRMLALLDRARLWIQCDDEARTAYAFSWASGYGNGAAVRIQGVLEPRTGREREITAAVVQQPTGISRVGLADVSPPRRRW